MFVLKDERRCDNQYRRSELLKDEMTVNLIFANNLRDFRISIIHRIGISDGSKQRLYIYIYKKLRKRNISFRSMYTLDSSKCHGMNMQASGSASGIRRNIFIRGQIYSSQQRFWREISLESIPGEIFLISRV